MTSVDELVKALEEQTEPHYAWKLAKEDAQAGTGATRGKSDYTKEVTGPELVDHLQHYSIDFYGGMKQAGNMDPEQLHQRLKQDLGPEDYLKVRNLLKVGDIDGANNMAKDDLVNKYGDAKAGPILEKISLLEPNERIAAGKGLATLVKGKDYVTASEHPDLVLKILSQQKALASNLN